MDFDSIRNRILSDDISTDEKIELIKELVDSDDSQVREFIESLLKSKNIRIRYFARKIIRDDVGLSEEIEKVTWKDDTDEKVKKIINEKSKQTNQDVTDRTEVKSPAQGFTVEAENGMPSGFKPPADYKKAFFVSISLLIAIFILIALYVVNVFLRPEKASEKNTDVEKFDAFTPAAVDSTEKSRIAAMRDSIAANYRNGKYFDAYLSQVTVFNVIDREVKKDDFSMLVSCLEKLSWEFLSENRENAEKYLNPDLRNTFGLLFQLFAVIYEKKAEVEKLLDYLGYKAGTLHLLSVETINRVNLAADEFPEPQEGIVIKTICNFYLKDLEAAHAGINKITDASRKKKLESLYEAYRKLNPAEVKKTPDAKDELAAALLKNKEGNLEDAVIHYIRAITGDIRIIRQDQQELLSKIAGEFLKIHISDVIDDAKMLLVTGFAQLISGNIEKAQQRFSKIEDSMYRELAEKLLKLSGNPKLMALFRKLSTLETGSEVAVSETPETGVSKAGNDVIGKLSRQKESLIASGKLDEAVTVLKQIAKLDPSSGKPFLELGEVYLKKGQTADAIDAYEQGLQVQPDRSDVRVRLADLCFQQGEIKKAKVHYGLTLFYETDANVIDQCQAKILELEKLKKK